jgi:hypothetical protein
MQIPDLGIPHPLEWLNDVCATMVLNGRTRIVDFTRRDAQTRRFILWHTTGDALANYGKEFKRWLAWDGHATFPAAIWAWNAEEPECPVCSNGTFGSREITTHCPFCEREGAEDYIARRVTHWEKMDPAERERLIRVYNEGADRTRALGNPFHAREVRS